MMTAITIVAILLLPLAMVGFVNKVKAVAAGRYGAPLLQPFFDVSRLLRKGEVVSEVTTKVFSIAPSLSLAALLTAALLVPGVGRHQILSFEGDVVVFFYLLGLARFFSIASALDTGSAFEGMGASREALIGVILEPALLLFVGTAALATSNTTFAELLALSATNSQWLSVALPTGVLLFFLTLLAEGCRLPIDDPNTHLELTMIHEVIILDNSGPDLAALHYGAALKMYLFASLIGTLLLPTDASVGLAVGLHVATILGCAVVTGMIESVVARFRMSYLPQFLFLGSALALIALAAALFYGGGVR